MARVSSLEYYMVGIDAHYELAEFCHSGSDENSDAQRLFSFFILPETSTTSNAGSINVNDTSNSSRLSVLQLIMVRRLYSCLASFTLEISLKTCPNSSEFLSRTNLNSALRSRSATVSGQMIPIYRLLYLRLSITEPRCFLLL